ncbi:MAG: hypothetical protein AB2L14_22695 [Candidatus Xenobiia bacterium LiM19]
MKRRTGIKLNSPERATALIVTLCLLPLFLVLALAFMTLSEADYSFSGQSTRRIKAHYLAESGIYYAYNNRSQWHYPYEEKNIVLSDGGRFDVKVEKLDELTGVLRISSEGKTQGTLSRINVIIAPGGRIFAWEEVFEGWKEEWEK